MPSNNDDWLQLCSLRPALRGPGYLYALLVQGTNDVKLGFCVYGGVRRIRALKTGNADSLLVIWERKVPNMLEGEKKLHAFFDVALDEAHQQEDPQGDARVLKAAAWQS